MRAQSSSTSGSAGETAAIRDDDCSIFERALDALPDGVLLVNAAREVVYANSAFQRLWNVPAELSMVRTDGTLLQFVKDQLVDGDRFVSEVERLHHTLESSHDELHFKDGRIFSRRSVPFREKGEFNARVWIFTDITEARSATFDQLTRLPNRLAFSRDFPRFVAAEPDGRTRAVGLMDIDNFKQYNDLYGHAAGDRVLRQVGEILRAHLHRTEDLLFRVGGEEFLIATCTAHGDEARSLFDNIRCSIAHLAREHRGNPPHGVVTASFGVGMFDGIRDADAVFEEVDGALYRAKAAGRNTVVHTTV